MGEARGQKEKQKTFKNPPETEVPGNRNQVNLKTISEKNKLKGIQEQTRTNNIVAVWREIENKKII